jgi:PAS domain S-box-containing protein
MRSNFEEMSKEELVAALHALEADVHRPGPTADATEHELVVHDLEVHRLELEMQNRELREAQHHLEESRQRYMDLYNFAPVVYVTLDHEGRIEEANLTAATFLGVERGQLLGKLLASFVVLGDRQRLRGFLRRCFHESDRAEVQLGLTVNGRSGMTVDAAGLPVRDAEDQVIGCRVTLTDISAVKQTEQRLALLAGASRRLGGALDGGIALGAALGQVLRSLVPTLAHVAILDLAEGAELRRFDAGLLGSPGTGGYPAPPLGPDSPQRRVLETDKPILVSACSPSTLGGLDGLDHEPAVRAAGARSLLYVPLTSRDKPLGVLTLISVEEQRRFSGADLALAGDLASRIATAIDNVRLYQSAQDAIRGRDDLLSFVAHDLRGLLSGVQMSVQMLIRGAPGIERRRGWKQLDRIHRVIMQMSHMIDDLTDLPSLDAGRFVFDLSDVPVSELLSQAEEMFLPAAGATNVTLEVRAPPEETEVRGDNVRVLRVLANLVGNALKFTPEGGRITISSSVAHRHVLFAVRDTGIGIAPEHLGRLFERYWQAEATAHKGRGLGLFIAKRLIEGQGGTIWAESQLGAGTTLFFTLPRAAPAEAALRASNGLADADVLAGRR